MDTAPSAAAPGLPSGGAPDTVAALLELVAARLPAAQVAQASTFVRLYYANVAPEDLAERAIDDLYGAALSHWHFARSFERGAPKLRVYNPRTDEHGWQSTHTVIEIVNDDMPFLVDSITMEVNRQGMTMHLIVHPVLRVRRDAQHRLVGIGPWRGEGEGELESLIHVEVDRRSDPATLAVLRDGLLGILANVRAAVRDWQPMRERVLGIVSHLETDPPPGAPETVAEDLAFLRWLCAGHFTFLGYREYDLVVDDDGSDMLRVVDGSGLGILGERATHDATAAESGPTAQGAEGPQPPVSASFASLPPAVRARAREPNLLVLTKSTNRATVHRPGYLDYVGIKRFDRDGAVVGECRVVGLYASSAYSERPGEIPILRRKVAAVAARTSFLPSSHAAKAFATILEQYPRDELFQIGEDELLGIASGILRLGERQRTRLFVRHDAFGRFVSCLIYVPRENYNTDLRARIQALLLEAYDGTASEFSVQFSDSPLARLWLVVRTRPGTRPEVDEQALERRIGQISRRWDDELRDALLEAWGEERGNALYARYANGFAAGYRDAHSPRMAVRDIEHMETLGEAPLAMSLYLPLEAPPGRMRFKLFRAGELAPLSHSLPMLEHMGVVVHDEFPYEVRRADGTTVWVDDFGVAVPGGEDIDIDRLRAPFQQAFLRTWLGHNESDGFNRLVMLAGIDWRSVVVLRAYARTMRQAGSTFSQAYIEQTLASQPAITAMLVALFATRFDPAIGIGDVGEHGARATAQATQVAAIEKALDDVSNLDEDRILRQFLALILATLRTNFHQRDARGDPKPVLSFKFDPAKIPGLPEPRPLFEIFVYSPRVEGVHLRGGRVARGGLRWSDRMEDYRTEVLGLAKAQQVKNAVIVPVGSKGGFVLKRPPPPGDRDALMREAVACYQAFLRGLLDLTDNLVQGAIVPPPDLVRHDPDDAYLVVAADKGTATFSDIANGVAAEYGFWLGDAFASGGSAGYDHKKMGITARGAWESVKRHFRTLGLDTQTQDFTVIGVGDMSGDVFGNGMLLSRHIRLVAAFDHRHVFIDPEPDAATGFAERERLFALPRSSWADYDPKLISEGGGVWPRTAKSITLSAKARAALGIDPTRASSRFTPNELMHAILAAPADLFYNGGIGTYVKASTESHADCGDRANDPIRVDASELRVKVVGEGGNLGCTQRGRIEFAAAGGLICTDAIDNSAGVDCSDHEVNIKILLDAVVAEGELTTRQRNRLLAEMTDEVAALVLRDNVYQNQVLAVSRARAPELLDEQVRFMRSLVATGRLNRRVEFLPSDEAIAERRQARAGLTTPELAVLLAYAKMALFDEVLDSDLPGDPHVAGALAEYFPQRLGARFAAQMHRHPLRREIIATHVVNEMVNRVGPSFVHRLREETGAASPEIVRAWLCVREIFALPSLWQESEALDHRVPVQTQDGIVVAGVRLMARATVWLVRHRLALRSPAATIERFAPGVAAVGAGLQGWLSEPELAAVDAGAAALVAQGVPAPLAQRVSRLDAQAAALDIVEVALEQRSKVETVAGVYFGVGGELDLGWLSQQIDALPAETHWQAMAKVAMRDELSSLARELTRSVLDDAPTGGARHASAAAPAAAGVDDRAGAADVDTATGSPAARIAAWRARREFQCSRYRQVLADLKPVAGLDMAMASVLLRSLRGLV
ncbi:MAG: NAD-glutamate dehydrogenase [Lautropia sp.]